MFKSDFLIILLKVFFPSLRISGQILFHIFAPSLAKYKVFLFSREYFI
jgi:hypothetical protein